MLDTLDEKQTKAVDDAIDAVLDGQDAKLDAEVEKSLSDDQKKVVHFMLEQAKEVAKNVKEDEGDDDKEDTASHSDDEGEELIMANVFDRTNEEEMVQHSNSLTHAQLMTLQDEMKKSTLKEAVLAHSAEYGIEQIEYLMPEYREFSGNGAPQFIKRDTTWVAKVMQGVHHTPFAKVKTTFADITEDEARARGYIKGKRKKEEVFKLMKGGGARVDR